MAITKNQRRGFADRGLAFAVAQLVIVPALAFAVWARSDRETGTAVLPQLNSQPLLVAPQYDNSLVITDEQLSMVLQKLRPQLAHDRPKINYVDHALRFWGAEASFDDPKCLSGAQMRQMLTDHRHYVSAWGEDARPLLVRDAEGVAVRTQQGHASSSHVDHTLATLAEVGTSLDYKVVTPHGDARLLDVARHALQHFSLNQAEYEWTALVVALYAPTTEPWYSREGQQITFDRIARRIMRQPYGKGCCYGNHRIYTLTILLRIDQEQQILFSTEVRQEVMDHLSGATRRLVASQAVDGYWDQNWHDSQAAVKSDRFSPLTRRLLATGHALEWWAMAPEELHPPREVVIRGGQWLVREIEKMNDETIRDNYTFLTHVGRALALWRGDFPAPLARRLNAVQQTNRGDG